MTTLTQNALLKADEVRMRLGKNMFQPINIFDTCIELGLTVRFVDVNMEGAYFNRAGADPLIVLSSLRPLPRRVYTCAHELGHHEFEHGTKVDALLDDEGRPTDYDDDELLVDTFAGALLMPVVGIQAAFTKRKWDARNCSPIDYYTISSTFGVGYHSVIYHCRVNQIISFSVASNLLKVTPAKIFKSILPSATKPANFKILDAKSKLSVVDLEVSNYIFLPPGVEVEGDHLEKRQITTVGTGYLAVKPGITRAVSTDGTFASFIRIQNLGYVGLAENRHLETLTD